MAIRIDRIVFLIIAVALLEGATSETKHKVGDNYGWRVPDNRSYYDQNWVAGKKFEVGDSLGKHIYDSFNFLWTLN
jgi:hypothetical protein